MIVSKKDKFMHRLYTKSMKVMAVVLGILAVTACDDEVASELGEEVVVTEEVITGAYIGNGFQWGSIPTSSKRAWANNFRSRLAKDVQAP